MLHVSASPHIRDAKTTQKIMLDVIIALVPALIASTLIFGGRALLLTLITVASAVLFEWLSRLIMKRENTVSDLSAVVTGLLLAFCLPPSLPYWMAIVGSFVAIVATKQIFGGIGSNFANPAIVGRIMLSISFAGEMNHFTAPGQAATDLVSSATPLALLRNGGDVTSTLDLFLGRHAGAIGETCALALLLGGVYLVVRGIIDLWIPLASMGTLLVFALIAGQNPLYHLLSGGLLLGAIFMATDYTTSPQTALGKLIFGIGVGFFAGLFRFFGASPEGLSFAILLMNILTPHIARWTKHKTIGGVSHV